MIQSIASIKKIGLPVSSVARNTSTTPVPLLMVDLIMMTSMVTLHAHRALRLPSRSHIYFIISLDYILLCDYDLLCDYMVLLEVCELMPLEFSRS